MKDEDLKELIKRGDEMSFLLGYTWASINNLANAPMCNASIMEDRQAIVELSKFLTTRLNKLFYDKESP